MTFTAFDFISAAKEYEFPTVAARLGVGDLYRESTTLPVYPTVLKLWREGFKNRFKLTEKWLFLPRYEMSQPSFDRWVSRVVERGTPPLMALADLGRHLPIRQFLTGTPSHVAKDSFLHLLQNPAVNETEALMNNAPLIYTAAAEGDRDFFRRMENAFRRNRERFAEDSAPAQILGLWLPGLLWLMSRTDMLKALELYKVGKMSPDTLRKSIEDKTRAALRGAEAIDFGCTEAPLRFDEKDDRFGKTEAWTKLAASMPLDG